MSTNEKKRHRLINRIPDLCRRNGIKTAKQLAEELEKYGVIISNSHASRYMRPNVPAPRIEMLEALCTLFKCRLNEIFELGELRDSHSVKTSGVPESEQEPEPSVDEPKKKSDDGKMTQKFSPTSSTKIYFH